MRNPQRFPGKKTGIPNPARVSGPGSAVIRTEARRSVAIGNPYTELRTDQGHRRIAKAVNWPEVLRRCFHGGADIEDWLESEAELDKTIITAEAIRYLPNSGVGKGDIDRVCCNYLFIKE